MSSAGQVQLSKGTEKNCVKINAVMCDSQLNVSNGYEDDSAQYSISNLKPGYSVRALLGYLSGPGFRSSLRKYLHSVLGVEGIG